LPRAGHLSNIENPEAFNRAALDWLEAGAGSATAPRRNFARALTGAPAPSARPYNSGPPHAAHEGLAMRCHSLRPAEAGMTRSEPHRRLVAILAADAAGFSRHMARDDAATVA
jgi:class 3 adenylate cyclase